MRPLLVLVAALAFPALAAELPSIDRPLRTGRSATGDAAVVIGVEDYVYLPQASYASQDAQAMYDFLVYTRGVPSSRVALLQGGTSRRKIIEAVTTAGKQVGAGGTVWVYFAGHGSASPSTRERLILPENTLADAGDFDEQGVRLAELQRLAGSGGGEVLLITDACFTGAGRAGGTLLSDGRAWVPPQATAVGRSVQWDAAQANQVAGPLAAARHGAFTYFAIGAMRGWADGQVTGERDGVVTSEEAHLYVREALRAVGIRDQAPSLVGEGAAARTLASGATERAPALDAAVAAPAPVPLPPVVAPRTGEAKVQLAGKDMDFAALAAAAQQASADAAAEKAAAEAAEAERARLAREAAAAAAAKAARAQELQDEMARRLAAERREKIDAAAAALRAAATRDYAAIAVLVSSPTPEGSPVLEAWLARYGSATVTVDQQTEAVEVPEAAAVIKALGKAGSGRDWTSPTVGLMKWIPPGTFTMGSAEGVGDSDQHPAHEVTLTRGYWLMEHEVTQGEWASVMGSNPSYFSRCGSSCPVEQVSWDDAQAFIKKVSARDGVRYRLPTEAEWEYAARGGQSYTYAGGNEPGGVAWTEENSGTTHPGCRKARNGYGLCDMSGNVREWVSDWNGAYPSGGVTDPGGVSAGSFRVIRGGSWSDSPAYARVAYRGRITPVIRWNILGLRLARVGP
jgi:formylglycine-generating enzyme required for sulfatase activity